MGNCLISVVVPVYNMEKYLARCLDSILRQTYRNIEIIVVNDGSTDESWSICLNYSLSDRRIKIVDQQNLGLSGARNTGLRYASGDYLTFVDSDDWVHPRMIEFLYNSLRDHSSDISFCGCKKISDFSIPDEQYENLTSYSLDRDTILHLFFSERYTACWSRLFRRDIIKDIEFPQGLNCEDYIYMYEALRRCQSVSIIDDPLYYYYVRPDSICSSSFNVKKFDAFYSAKKLYELVCINDPHFACASLVRLAGALSSLISSARKYPGYDGKKKELLGYLRKHISCFLFNRYIPLKQKIILAITTLPDNCAAFLFNLILRK